MNWIQRKIARFLIPKGYYCDDCPFYFQDATKPEQENGYCSYLGKGDWDINAEYPVMLEIQRRQSDGSFRKEFVNKNELMPLSLLFDGVKECRR